MKNKIQYGLSNWLSKSDMVDIDMLAEDYIVKMPPKRTYTIVAEIKSIKIKELK